MTLTLAEAAEIAKCHPDTLADLARAGEAPGTKIGRSWVFSERLLVEWIEKRCLSTAERAPRTGGSGSPSLAASGVAGYKRGTVISIERIP